MFRFVRIVYISFIFQVVASHAYSSSQPDELALQPGDVVNVLTKMADGWFYGERLRDSEKGWFPGMLAARKLRLSIMNRIIASCCRIP